MAGMRKRMKARARRRRIAIKRAIRRKRRGVKKILSRAVTNAFGGTRVA